MQDWRTMSAGDLGRAIGAGRIDPVELTAAFLDAIRETDPEFRIYARTTEARALAEAEAAGARARAGQRLSPLDGVPISWKDLFDTAGTATEAGSLLLKGRIPHADAEVLAKARLQGLVCLGKTHMTELAFSGLGVNPMAATPPNVNDPALAPGGSSSGAATSVAFGLAAAGIGSDTGGSVRIPAAWNNLVGLKTTHGRLPLTGVVPLCESFDTVGPLTRTVEDASLLLAAMEGTKPADLRGASLRGARLLVMESVALPDCREAPLAAFENAVARLQAAGATVERDTSPELEEAQGLSGILFTTEAYGTWAHRIEAEPDLMYAPVRERFRLGRRFAGSDYVAGWRRLHELRALWRARTAGYDAVLTPTSPILPPDVARLMSDEAYFTTENLLALRNTRIGNLMGLCGLTLPTGVPACGITLLGAPMGEERLLRLGAAAEAALA
ncbi:amidase [Albidovulum sediminicola]|uniref:Amidase family protein n=1 Tax=Albidovulum sediminicola TaxID=2984331 RepID=A0ABT2YYC5_9RHOB|nr:amidase family protein [Defluviimonas sp. WL0075]MCV2863880.1 amidase family protein [Defluviimonas sp. WL0075]